MPLALQCCMKRWHFVGMVFVSLVVTQATFTWASRSPRPRIRAERTTTPAGVPFYVLDDTGPRRTVGDGPALAKQGTPHLILNGEDTFFQNPETLVQVYKMEDRDIRPFFQKLNPDIQSCLSNSAVPSGTSVQINEEMTQLCRKPDLYYGAQSAYLLTKSEDALEIDMKFQFTYQGRPENRSASMENLESALRCTERFFAENGLLLRLSRLPEGQPVNTAAGELAVNIHDYAPGDDADNWAMIGMMEGYPNTPETICLMVAHEVGHHLGLPDRYETRSCPDRAEVTQNREDVMNFGVNSVHRLGRFIGREDVRKIIAPVCGQPSPRRSNSL